MSIEKSREFPLKDEYKKKTCITPEDITKLRIWLDTQPHLPGEFITDLDLILAYHCSGRSAEVAKQLLDLHFTMRTLFTSFFKDRRYDSNMQFAQEKLLMMAPLPTRSPDGYAAFYMQLWDRDSKKFILSDCCRAGLMRMDLWQHEEGTWPGLLLLVNLENMTLGHLAKLDVQSVSQFLYYLQEAMLVNLKGLHFLNAPAFMDRFMLFLRPFLTKSLMSMLHIHQAGSRTLDSFFPIDQLPTGALGGQGTRVEDLRDQNLARMAAGRDFFIEENKKRVTESNRPGKPKTISDIFGGVEGSFKKLDID